MLTLLVVRSLHWLMSVMRLFIRNLLIMTIFLCLKWCPELEASSSHAWHYKIPQTTAYLLNFANWVWFISEQTHIAEQTSFWPIWLRAESGKRTKLIKQLCPTCILLFTISSLVRSRTKYFVLMGITKFLKLLSMTAYFNNFIRFSLLTVFQIQ